MSTADVHSDGVNASNFLNIKGLANGVGTDSYNSSTTAGGRSCTNVDCHYRAPTPSTGTPPTIGWYNAAQAVDCAICHGMGTSGAAMPMAHPPGRFGATVVMRPARGFPPFGQKDTRTLAYVRVLPGGALDRTRLLYLADATPPRVFLISDGPRPSSTITMSVYFYATDAKLAEVGEDYIVSDVAGVRAEGSTSGLTMRLWSRSGALLATSEQLCWFR